MIRQLLSVAIGLAIVLPSAMGAERPDTKALKAAVQRTSKTVRSVDIELTSVDKEEFLDPKAALKLSDVGKFQDLKFADAPVISALDSVVGKAVKGEISSEVMKPRMSYGTRAPKLVTGTFISKDINYQNVVYSYRLSVEPTDKSGVYSLSNLYGLEKSIEIKIDEMSGQVTVPVQKLYEHSTYGEVSIVPLHIETDPETGAYSFMLPKGDLQGWVGPDGTIMLGTWGIMVTQKETPADGGDPVPTENYGRLFNIFKTSDLLVPNTTVACNIVSQNKLAMYETYIEQTQPNEVVLYGFNNINAKDVMLARLTGDKKIIVSSQLIYNNLFYGPFMNYPATFTFDSASDQYKVKVDSKNAMTFIGDGKGSFSLAGWVIAAKSSPTSAIGYAYSDVNVATEADLKYPESLPLNFKGSGTEMSPYIIESVTHIQALSQAVENGNDFAGVYFQLANDLDFSDVSPTGYVPVGNTETPFNGIFYGKGHKIFNFKADGKGFENTGLFGVIGKNGIVDGLKFEKSLVTSMGTNVGVAAAVCSGKLNDISVNSSLVDCDGELGGGIVGDVIDEGAVTNCSFSGSVYSSGSGAGIAGRIFHGTVRNCEVHANIIIDGVTTMASNKEGAGVTGTALSATIENCFVSGTITDKLGYHRTGGIAGYVSSSSISNCFNTAPISAKRAVLGSMTSANDGETYTGGLVGYISDSSMQDCYNSGTIIKPDRSECVGGLIGYLGVTYIMSSDGPTTMGNISNIKNCYNSAQIISTSVNPRKGIYGQTFTVSYFNEYTPEEACFKNVYFDGQIAGLDYAPYSKKTRDLINALPDGFDATIWKQSEGLYPVLASVGTDTQAQELSALPLVLREKDNKDKVKVRFEITPSKNVTWKLGFDETAGETASETNSLKMEGSKVIVKDRYDNAVMNAASSDNWSIKVYSLSIVPKLFEGEGTSEDPYLLSEIKDWKNLHEAVALYNQGHKDDYFVMTKDIDFGLSDEFHGVGFGTSREFQGSLNGLNHIVRGLKIDAGDYDARGKATNNSLNYCGLFSVLGENGTVRNVSIADDCDFTFYNYGGAIAGLSCGKIENCRNYSNIKGIASYIGGIAGVNYDNGTILKCYNAGAVNFGISNAGGITGYNRATGLVQLCQNDGEVANKVINVTTVKTKSNTVGGISGYNYGVVDRCVNNGLVRAYNTVGGIVGYANSGSGEGHVRYSINNGIVTSIDATLYRGGVAGQISLTGLKLAENYYDSSINVNGGANNNSAEGIKGLSSSELVSGEVLANLSSEDFDFKANNYPVLRVFANEEASKAMRSIYVGFAPKILRTNILQDTPLSKEAGVTFSLESEKQQEVTSNFKLENSLLTVIKPEGMTLATDSLTASIGDKYVKGYVINAVPEILKGEGSEESPYLIETPADWNKLAEFIQESKWEYNNNFFRITNDLDFQNDSIKLIAIDGVNFQATLDGARHTIKNYLYNNPNTIKTRLQGPNLYVGQYLGLIGTLGSAGTLKDLILQGSIDGYRYLASAVGENYGLVENITNLGNVNTSKGYTSGIVNRSYDGSIIRNCINEGKISSGANYCQGIVYETKAGALVENCLNKGEIVSTTGNTFGIAYKVAGGMKDCHNTGKLEGSGTISGVVHTVDKNGWLENCSNSASVDLSELPKPGSNIFGIASTLTARTEDSAELGGGYVKNCHNYGNLKGANYIYGGISTISAGWTVSDCSNTGDVTSVPTSSTSSALAMGFANKIGGGKNLELLSKMERCFNSGKITSNAPRTSGLAGESAKYSHLVDCYNLGDIVNTYTGTSICAAGLVAQHNGVMERCFNAGDVVSYNPCIGGLVGYIASGEADYPAVIRNCFNIGDITSYYTGSNTNGNAGGLGGYLSTVKAETPHIIENCYNTGNITAERRVAGLFAGAFRYNSIVRNCYNSGKITCRQADSEGRYYWSGTTFSNSYEATAEDGTKVFMLAGHTNCYYDGTVNPGNQFRNVPNSKKTTEELRKLKISDAFEFTDHEGYPVLSDFIQHDVAHAGSALILLSSPEDESYDKILGEIMLIGPDGAEWSAEDVTSEDVEMTTLENDENAASTRLSINGNVARPIAEGAVILKCAYKGQVKKFYLNVDGNFSSVVEESFAGKDVKEVELIDLQGRKVLTPEPGQVYIMRTVFTDGTMKVEKKIAKN